MHPHTCPENHGANLLAAIVTSLDHVGATEEHVTRVFLHVERDWFFGVWNRCFSYRYALTWKKF